MSLTAGTRIGSYEVTGPLGAGGMGEVYRARDHKLDRDVALKILPEAFASDAERLARFEREAKALAALNHPNIAQIYGVEDSTSAHALVMELVEGATLADRIAEAEASALQLDEALDLARQIADALQAAHDQGIIHRDLKPANIKVRPDGTVKVLDFGLAKLTTEAAEASASGGPGTIAATGLAGLTNSPTLTLGATQAGIILGTAAYMSPEQAKGRLADKRSDIWAFGCVLYEMLSGRRAFEGDDASDTLASVLKIDPDWHALPADVPAAIRTLIQRCLVKDHRRRIADISVAQFVLAEAASLCQSSASRGDRAPSEEDERNAASRVHPAILVAAAALVTAVVAAAAGWTLWPSSPTAAVTRFTLPLAEDQQFSATGRQLVAIAPDGGQFVFVAGNRLYIRSLSEFGSRAIPGAEWKEGVSSPVFSPDGANVAFHSMQALKQVPVGGGAPVTLCSIETPYGLTWHASGVIAGQGRFGIVRCPSNGGSPEQLVKVDQVAELAHGPQLRIRVTDGRRRRLSSSR
jgi:eukaryotic-like serine/threonine-protein kinase